MKRTLLFSLIALIAIDCTPSELDLQQNTGQIFKLLVVVAHYSIQKGKDTPALNAFAADCTKSPRIQRLPA